MRYVNIPITDVFRSVEFLGSDPTERSTFVSLLAFCVERENGGRIEAASTWKDRKWQQICAVTRRETRLQCDLWHWEEDDLVLFWYPHENEEHVRKLRDCGKKGGRPASQNETKSLLETGDKVNQEETIRLSETEPTENLMVNHKVNQEETIRLSETKPYGFPKQNHMGGLKYKVKYKDNINVKGEENLTFDSRAQENQTENSHSPPLTSFVCLDSPEGRDFSEFVAKWNSLADEPNPSVQAKKTKWIVPPDNIFREYLARRDEYGRDGPLEAIDKLRNSFYWKNKHITLVTFLKSFIFTGMIEGNYDHEFTTHSRDKPDKSKCCSVHPDDLERYKTFETDRMY